MPPADGEGGLFACGQIHRLLLFGDAWGGLERDVHDDVHAGRDAAEDAARVVGHGSDGHGIARSVGRLFGGDAERIVVLRAGHPADREAVSKAHALDARDAEDDRAEQALEAVVHRAADAAGHTGHNAADTAADAVAVRFGCEDALVHRVVFRRHICALHAARFDELRVDGNAFFREDLQGDAACNAERGGHAAGERPAACHIDFAVVAQACGVVRVTGTRGVRQSLIIAGMLVLVIDLKSERLFGCQDRDVRFFACGAVGRAARCSARKECLQLRHIDVCCCKPVRQAFEAHADGRLVRAAEDGHFQVFADRG